MVQIKGAKAFKKSTLPSLPNQLSSSFPASSTTKNKRAKTAVDAVFEDDYSESEHSELDEKTAKKILQQANQQISLDIESGSRVNDRENYANESDSEEEEEEEEVYSEIEEGYEGLDISPEDKDILNSLMPATSQPRDTLADLILSRIKQEPAKETDIPQQVTAVYSQVGSLLARYKSGKLPKAFKIIPSLSNWEEILYLTQPSKWTTNAMLAATKIFCSNLHAKIVHKFYSLILLDRIRDDIRQNKKLNVHLYQALKKAVYRPSAFFKGLVLPLAQSGDVTLKEAVIFASILKKTSIPVLHSSACLLKLSQLPYSGATSIFIKTLLDKKYSLPYKALSSLYSYFMATAKTEKLPVLWHQSLLTLVQRYKHDFTSVQKQDLINLTKIQRHAVISGEIVRELNSMID